MNLTNFIDERITWYSPSEENLFFINGYLTSLFEKLTKKELLLPENKIKYNIRRLSLKTSCKALIMGWCLRINTICACSSVQMEGGKGEGRDKMVDKQKIIQPGLMEGGCSSCFSAIRGSGRRC